MKQRVLILGGGAAGLATAWQLSCTAERRAAFEVTVASMGWRLGGKGATGRSLAHGARIHEHGLHIWMGFYRNAFAVTGAAFDAWTPPAGGRLRRIEDGFVPHYTVSLTDRGGHTLHVALPPLPGRPWSDERDLRGWMRELRAWTRAHARPALRASASDRLGSARHLRDLGRLGATIARGLAREGRDPWERLDEEDLCAWLRRHGGDDPRVHDSSAIRAFYNLAFAYPDGVSGFGKGSVAAGTALKALLRMGLTYRGAPLWKMTAGMGDTVFVPLYEVLRDRGVRFSLFRRVDALRVSGGALDAVELGVQAEADGYDPLIEVGAERCWPDGPVSARLGRIADGDLEGQGGGSLRTEILRRGVDFDAAVLAVPVPVHPRIAGELSAAAPRYRAMVDHHASVVTTAAQLWLRGSLREAGWDGPSTIAVNGAGGLSSWADMTEVGSAEAWAVPPQALLYFVDVAPEGTFQGVPPLQAARMLGERLRPWLADPDAFPRADDLCHGALAPDEDPLSAQYYKVNADPSDRYVLSLPGSTKHRLGPESGVPRLWLAGDWTRTSINGGSVEAAVESGRRAGEAVAASMGRGTGRLRDAPI